MSTALSKYFYYNCSQGPFGIASCSLPEVGVFPIIVYLTGIVEVMSVEVLLGFGVEKTS